MHPFGYGHLRQAARSALEYRIGQIQRSLHPVDYDTSLHHLTVCGPRPTESSTAGPIPTAGVWGFTVGYGSSSRRGTCAAAAAARPSVEVSRLQ